ncbi:hypothetical protein EPA93_04365 [Ktedonosporobacter rubrisoli]|uniref:Uncharacterized protein n=1 Tax=Ktedonosporobacter rubrisoli TaxID=2509675 RepID=A0A4P6JJZ3_KTERU|nr:hypothetical protein [Ktedonosporobacter rubrisoli]QBD75270.1 hypothetical protein EPA93_04365 [Ktedonosporobacter rubrisoli]
MRQERQNLLREALEGSEAETALVQIVLAWKAAGMKQQEALDEFEQYRKVLRAQAEEQKEDVLMDVMDCIIGWCPAQRRLF